MHINNYLKTILLLGGFILIPLLVSASGDEVACPVFSPVRAPETLECLVPWIFYYVLIISGFFLVIVLIIAGFKYLFATGNPNRIADAKDQLIKGFFGVVLVLASFMIVHILNPELVIRGIKVPEAPIREEKRSGFHLCYKITAGHFYRPDLNFRCHLISYKDITISDYHPIQKKNIQRYGKPQEYRAWKCRVPQIKHKGLFRFICYNLAQAWIDMLPFEAYLLPQDIISPWPRPSPRPDKPRVWPVTFFYPGFVPPQDSCADIFGQECLRITGDDRCVPIAVIKILTPKYQCYEFWTNSNIEQNPLQKFEYYRIVREDEQPSFIAIYHTEIDFEGGCYDYIKDPNALRGEVRRIPAVAGRFHSFSLFNFIERRYPGTVTLFEGAGFADDKSKVTIPAGETLREYDLVGKLRNNIRSLEIEKKAGDEPIVAILFSETGIRGFCEVFIESDHNLENNRIGQEKDVDAAPPPKRVPWLFHAPTAESIMVISGEKVTD
jgi:hypothetical protein